MYPSASSYVDMNGLGADKTGLVLEIFSVYNADDTTDRMSSSLDILLGYRAKIQMDTPS